MSRPLAVRSNPEGGQFLAGLEGLLFDNQFFDNIGALAGDSDKVGSLG